jgi:hypothetical protein
MPDEEFPGVSSQTAELPRDPEGPVVDALFETPEQKSATTIEFRMDNPEGIELRPGHAFEFVVPEAMRGRMVRDVILQHRKGEKYRVEGSKQHDPYGAYSRVEAHDTGTGVWLQWRDPKGYSPDKYAEWRPANDPENEALHDWLATVGAIRPDVLRVTNVGQNPDYSVSQIHALEVVFYPEQDNVSYEEAIYTPGTQFIDPEKGRLLPAYGGGSHTEGRYENAIALGSNQANDFALNTDAGPNVEVADSYMAINLPAGRKLIQAEVAAGDTEHLSKVNPKTGKPTRLGWAKLSIGIQHADSQDVEWFVTRANVPPQGVLAGGPTLEAADIRDGDRLVIHSSDDTSYVMGWRLAFELPEEAPPPAV